MSALDGTLVLDLTRHLPGPLATLFLADFGATVVKVEGPEGDPLRHFPPHGDDGAGVAFRALNAGKLSLGLDLKNPDGRALFLRLVDKADVVVEGFRPGVLDRLGAGWDACSARNPRIVFVSITGYGQDGPYRDLAGHDLDYQAYAGLLRDNKDVVGAPVVPAVQVADVTGSHVAVSATLLALLARVRTGKGQRVDVSLMDAAVAARTLQLVPALADPSRAFATEVLAGATPCYGIYATRDGRFGALGALEPKFFERFCEAVGKPEWASRGVEPGSDLKLELAALFAEKTLDEWRALLEPAGCCFAPVLEPAEVARDPQVRARGLILENSRGPLRLAPPARLLGTPARPSLRAPARVGQDTTEVLERVLGVSAKEIDELRARGALGR